MDNVWVLVADHSRARLFACERLGKALSLLDTIDRPEGRAHLGELVTDAPPSARSSGGGGRHALAEGQDVKRELDNRFVRSLVDRLDKAYLAGRFRRLAVIAAPAMLGQWRRCVVKSLSPAVVLEIDKDLAQAPVAQVEKLLRDAHLWVTGA